MKRIIALLAAGLAGALIALAALSFTGTALAQGPTGQAGNGGAQMAGRGARMGGSAESLVGMAAAKLGLAQADLVAQLGADGTIAAALTAGDVDPKAFIDEFVAVRAARLEAAVAAGTLTQPDADARLATAQSMSTARIYQPFTAIGPGGQGQGGAGAGTCDQAAAGAGQMRGQGGMAGAGQMRGPRR